MPQLLRIGPYSIYSHSKNKQYCKIKICPPIVRVLEKAWTKGGQKRIFL